MMNFKSQENQGEVNDCSSLHQATNTLDSECLDSTEQTLLHIAQVRANLEQIENDLKIRAQVHDQSKLSAQEKPYFDEFTPLLCKTEYGSQDYLSFLEKMKPALENHYAENSHHPEFYSNGIQGMCLLDLIEMLADWKASSLRNKNGDLKKSLPYQKERFAISDDLYQILMNTVHKLKW